MESIAVPVTLTLEVRPEGADIGSLERAVSVALSEAGQRLWAELVGALERLVAVPAGHPGCGGVLRSNGRARRRIVTLAGEVEVHRRRYRCGACGGELVPLDEALGLEPRSQHTLGVRERALWLATELSYARTARTLEELRGLAVSHGQVHRWVAAEGSRLEAATAARTEAVLGAHPERDGPVGPRDGDVWVSADGTMVHDRGSGTHVEVQLGLVFRGIERIGRDRRRLLERHYVGATGSWTTFAERLVAACAAMGVTEARRVLFVSDGALAIRTDRGTGLSRRDRAARLVPPGRGPAPGHRPRPRGGARAGHRRGAARRRRGPSHHSRHCMPGHSSSTIPSRPCAAAG
jgi:hypothetical protein